MTVKEFYEACKGVGEAEWEDYKGVIVGYCSENADEEIDENILQFIFNIDGGSELVEELSMCDLLNDLSWGSPTPKTLAKYLKK